MQIAIARSRDIRAGMYSGREVRPWKNAAPPFASRFVRGLENGEIDRLAAFGSRERTTPYGRSVVPHRSSNEASTIVPTKSSDDTTIGTFMNKSIGVPLPMTTLNSSSAAALPISSPYPLLPAPRPAGPNLTTPIPPIIRSSPSVFSSLPSPPQQLLTKNPLLGNAGHPGTGDNLNSLALNGFSQAAIQQLLCQQAFIPTTPVPAPSLQPDVISVVASLAGLQNSLPLNQLLALQMLALTSNGAGNSYLPLPMQYPPGMQYSGLTSPLINPMATGFNGIQYANAPGTQFNGYSMLPAEYPIAMAPMVGMGGIGQTTLPLLCDPSQVNSLSALPSLGAVTLPALLPNIAQSIAAPNGAGGIGGLTATASPALVKTAPSLA